MNHKTTYGYLVFPINVVSYVLAPGNTRGPGDYPDDPTAEALFDALQHGYRMVHITENVAVLEKEFQIEASPRKGT